MALVVAVFVAGCNEERHGIPRLVTAPSPAPQPAPEPQPIPPPLPPPTPRPITLGEAVKDTFVGQPLAYEVTPQTSGTLVVRLDWDVWYNGTLMVLDIEGTSFLGKGPEWSPLVGKVQVSAGRTCLLTVKPGGTDWFYNDPFVLTTSIE